jgi:hypothetical protein
MSGPDRPLIARDGRAVEVGRFAASPQHLRGQGKGTSVK